MKKILLIGIVLVLLLPVLVSAATYYVAKDGSGDYTSIQAASNAAQPGDTIYIRAGTYTETIRPARSGTAGNPITYAKSGSGDVTITGGNYGIDLSNINYIVIDGLRIENTYHWIDLGDSHHNVIKNCYLYRFGGWMGIWMKNSDHHKIFNNTLIAPCTGSEEAADLIYCRGNCEHNVIEDNYLEYGTHTTISFAGTEGISDYNVIRNNRIWNPWHTLISVWDRADHSLIEGNILLDGGEDYINNDCGQPGDKDKGRKYHAGIQLGSHNCIIRNNILINNGWMEINSYPSGSNVPGAVTEAIDNRIYHNTFHKNHWGPASEGMSGYPIDENVFKNNLLYKQVNYEIYMSLVEGVNYFFNNNILGANYYLGPDYVESGTLKLDPKFINEGAVSHTNNKNFKEEYVHLQSSSPMIDAGDFLTKTRSAGSGTNIPVEDAGYFYDGWEIEGEVGDLIQLQGSTTTARITNVDYSSNTITVDRSLTWSSGTGVALSYSGSAPDIGAFEYGGTTPPPPPPPPPTCSNCKVSACNTYNDCTTATGTCYSGYYCCQGSCTTTVPPCTENDWSYSDGACQPSNTLTRTWTKTGTCTGGVSHPATQTINCDYNQDILPGLSWEAEDRTIAAPFTISNGYVYQQSGCVGSPVSSCGKASYTFNIDNAGNYIVKAVVDAADTAKNSFFVNIDAEPTDPYMIWDILPYTNGFQERTVSWRGDGTFDNNEFVPKIFTLSTGTHELIIRGREGNTLLDKITIELYQDSNIPGDVNNNGHVDIFDLVAVASDFGKRSGLTYPKADTDSNGIVDIFDIVFVATRIE